MHLVVIFGPPAVGKMTVGQELCRRTGFKLFHNHLSIEPLLEVFAFGSPPFNRLVDEFRRRVIEEAVEAGLAGLVFTFVWGLELKEDRALIESYLEIVEGQGGSVHFVELVADQATRLERNETALRLEHKRSKRDLLSSRRQLLDLDNGYVLNTSEGRSTVAHAVLDEHGWLRIDNSRLAAVEVAAMVAEHIGIASPS